MPSSLEVEFNEAMLDIYGRAKSEAGYTATRFLRLVIENGGKEAAHILINAPTVSEGYTALWERGRIDLTVEAMILRNIRYHGMFTADELAICQARLRQYGAT